VRARYIIGTEGRVDSTDRGIAYGDGLFETMLLRDASVQRLALHLDRLAVGCERLALPMPDRVELESQIAAAADGIDRGSLKLILTRGNGPRGYSPPASPTPTVILLAEAGSGSAPAELTLATLRQRLGENEKLAGIKHLNRLEQVLGRLELSELDADEGLMLSANGSVIGGTSRNLFAVFGDTIRTPSVSRAGIAGVMRRTVIEQCRQMSVACISDDIQPETLLEADELFMTNALVGIQSVARLDQTGFSSRATATRLSRALGLTEDEANNND
jgi:4-amino-4-deoxychorismate lyase